MIIFFWKESNIHHILHYNLNTINDYEQKILIGPTKMLITFFSQSHSGNSRKIDRQILPMLIILKLSYLRKKICKKWTFYEFLVCGIEN